MTSKKLRIMVTQILYFFIVLLTGSTSLAGSGAPRPAGGLTPRQGPAPRRLARKLQTTGTGMETRTPAAEPAPQPEAPPLRQPPAPRPAARKLQTTGAGTVPSPTPAEPRPAAGGPSKKDRRTVGPPNFPNFPNLLNLSGIPKYSARPSIGFTQVAPTSPSGFSWSSSWIAASSGFWHVPARSGRSAAGPWSRTGSNNSCC